MNYAIIALAVFYLALIFGFLHYKSAYEAEARQNAQLESMLDTQNATIEKLEIDTESYRKSLKAQKEKIVVKYESVKNDKELETCEAKINEIINIVEIFSR